MQPRNMHCQAFSLVPDLWESWCEARLQDSTSTTSTPARRTDMCAVRIAPTGMGPTAHRLPGSLPAAASHVLRLVACTMSLVDAGGSGEGPGEAAGSAISQLAAALAAAAAAQIAALKSQLLTSFAVHRSDETGEQHCTADDPTGATAAQHDAPGATATERR